ncbi:ParB N-terminal domain-containing protein, partial [Halobacillus sp. BAB-2008]
MLHPFGRLFGLGDKPDSDKGSNEEEGYSPDEVVQVPVERVQPNRYQPRAIFNNEKISELAQTIHTHG